MKLQYLVPATLFSILVLASCGGNSEVGRGGDNPKDEPVTSVERTYKGNLSCAGCEGLFSELTIRERPSSKEFTYLLKETYNNGDAGMQTLNDSGSIQVMANEPAFGNDTTYWIKGGRAGDRYYRQLSADSLELVDSKGQSTGTDRARYLVIRP